MKTIPEDVAIVFERSIEFDFDTRTATIVKQLDRKRYVVVNEILEAFGGKWDKKSKVHKFFDERIELIPDSISSRLYLDPRSDLNFFPTPPELAEYIVGEAMIERGDRVLEPSAGKGALLRVLATKTNKLLFCEIDRFMRDALVKEQSDEYIARWELLCPDFLEVPNMQNLNPIDIIVANPPFSKGRDVLHVSTMLDVARVRVVSVMSSGFIFRTDKKTEALKEKLTKDWNWNTIDLGKSAFKSSGTDVNTVLLVAERKG
jgi:predicted RNA methylase